MKTSAIENSILIVTLLIFTFLTSCANNPQKPALIELNSNWKFKSGDSLAFAEADFDDSSWDSIAVDKTWDKQGYKINRGFAWYRLRVTIPSSLKDGAIYKDSLIIRLGKIDDFNQVFLNGEPIGENLKNLPPNSDAADDFKNLSYSFWDIPRRYSLALNDKRIHWDKENVIAVRVFNWNGPGGIYAGKISIGMQDIKDYLKLDISKNRFTFKENSVTKNIQIKNSSANYLINGKLDIIAQDNISRKVLLKRNFNFSLKAGDTRDLDFDFPKLERSASIQYKVSLENSANTIGETEGIPYILTPPAKKEPSINGALIYGQRPDRPFLYRVAASGEHPIHFKISGLPKGLTADSESGIIRGSVHKKGTYTIDVSAYNEYGNDRKKIKLVIGDKIALTPPMGWNSWNCWGLSVTQQRVYQAAEAFIKTGIADHGWSYINIDDGWEIFGKSSQPKRKTNGEILTNEKFPNIKKLGEDIHKLGLKFGIYSSPGPLTCGGYTASYKHELQDARTFAQWGVDYLKYDLCSYRKFMKDSNDPQELIPPYQMMNKALSKIDRDIIYSICEYGNGRVWEWGAKVGGNLWRTTGDIYDEWDRLFFIGFNQEAAAPYSGPGHWNDPDMLIIGQLGWSDNLHPSNLSPDEQYTHVSLWALLSAPLLLGCDLTKLDKFTLNLITNDEVLSIDQDPLGNQAVPVIKENNIHVYKKRLENGASAIGIFNISDKTALYKLEFGKAGLNKTLHLRDLWRQKNLGEFHHSFEDTIPAHGVRLLSAF